MCVYMGYLGTLKEIESNSASIYTVQTEDFSASNDIPIDLDGPI